MDFSRVALSDDEQTFLDDTRTFLAEQVTEDVIRRDRETGDNFDEGVHLALGARGYLASDWKDEVDGGFSPLRRRIWDLEIGRAHTPWFHWGTTAMVAHTVAQFGSSELKDEVLAQVLSGHYRLCLGYTEPEGGSDVATCKTRAVRDGNGWIINGSKMRERTLRAQAEAKHQADDYIRAAARATPADELHKLHELVEKGALTQEEYDRAKGKLLPS